jgi:hypothetical protein
MASPKRPRYEVFLNAPSSASLRAADLAAHHWQTHRFVSEPGSERACTPPPATLAAAHKRIESLYGGMIWNEEDEEMAGAEERDAEASLEDDERAGGKHDISLGEGES